MSLRNTIGRTANLVEIRAPGSQGSAGATWQGNWAAGVTYNQNDLIRYISNGNLYFHSNATASLSADPSNLPTNTSNWDLFASIADAEGWANTIRHTTYTDISGISLTDETPSPSAAWEVSKSHSEVSQTSTSGSGTGVKFSITTDTAGNPYIRVTNVGSGYAVNDTIVVTDPGSTSSTATVTVNSIIGDTGYSSKHSKFQARDWGFKTDGFVPKEVSSVTAADIPNVSTGADTITFDSFTDTAGGESLSIAHGFSKDDPIRFRIVANATYGSPVMPTGITAEALYYVLSVSGNDITIAAIVDGSAINITAAGTGTLVALDDYSAKAWAIGGTDITATAGAGASKQWATDIEFTFANTAINTSTNVIDKGSAHGLTTDTKVKVNSDALMPLLSTSTRLNPTTTYYFENLTTNTFKLHTSLGVSSAINFTDQGGSGTLTLATQVDGTSGEWSSKYYAGAAAAHATRGLSDFTAITVGEIDAGTLITSSESFADTDDTKLPTVKAVITNTVSIGKVIAMAIVFG